MPPVSGSRVSGVGLSTGASAGTSLVPAMMLPCNTLRFTHTLGFSFGAVSIFVVSAVRVSSGFTLSADMSSMFPLRVSGSGMHACAGVSSWYSDIGDPCPSTVCTMYSSPASMNL